MNCSDARIKITSENIRVTIVNTKRTLIIQAHPNPASFCQALAEAYAVGARSSGDNVRFINLHALTFDPVLHQRNRGEQQLEADLLAAQNEILWAEHLVFVYPNWWGSMPSLLKGFIDRSLLPGFAYCYRANSALWDKLLTGRTARLLVTMDTPGWYYRWVWNRPGHNQMKHTILGFCGIKTTGISEFTPMHGSVQKTREQWLSNATAMGKKRL